MASDSQKIDQELEQELKDAFGAMSADELAQLSAAGAGPEPKKPEPDERGRIRGTIVGIRNADVFVDIGGKSEAFLTIDEFEPEQPPQVGEIHYFMLQGFDRDSGLMRLSLREAKRDAHWETLQVGDVVEARVTGTNIGGLELSVHNLRGFMPKSQVDIVRHEDFGHFVGKRLECEVVEVDRKGRNLLLSHRRVLERQREVAREEMKQTLMEGQTRRGVVSRIADFGVFVDLGGVDGLLHVSDMSYRRVNHPKDMLKVGDEVEVKVLKIDPVKDRISLGMKQLAADPWALVEANYRAGATVDGRVTKLMDFGAFVELEAGVEGLIPISEMSWTRRINHPRDLLKEGDSVRVNVLAVDPEKRRISLSLKALGQDPWIGVAERYQPQSIVSGLVMRIAQFGAFIQLEEGIEGLAHISELSDKRVRGVGDVVKIGDVVKARVLAVDPENRKISLSLKGAVESSEAPAGDEQAIAAAQAAAAAKPKRKKPLRGGLNF